MTHFLFDSQLLDAVQLCEQKFVYDFMDNLKQAQPNRKLEMGSLLHEFEAAYFRGIKAGKSHEVARDESAALLEQLIPNMGISSVDAGTVQEAFIESTDFHWGHMPFTVKSVEDTHTKVIHENAHVKMAYVSKIDLIADLINVENMPVDHKSEHSRNDPEPGANQFMGYAWYTGSNRILISKVGFQKTLKPADKYRQYTFYYTEAQKQEWAENTVLWAYKMIELVNGRKPLMNKTSCDKWGGCKYKAVCSLSPENRPYQIEQMFTVQPPWNPLELKTKV